MRSHKELEQTYIKEVIDEKRGEVLEKLIKMQEYIEKSQDKTALIGNF